MTYVPPDEEPDELLSERIRTKFRASSSKSTIFVAFSVVVEAFSFIVFGIRYRGDRITCKEWRHSLSRKLQLYVTTGIGGLYKSTINLLLLTAETKTIFLT